MIVERLEQAPELRQIIDDRSVLKAHKELIDLLMTAMVPAGRDGDYYAFAVPPFGIEPFYESQGWRRLGLGESEHFHEHLNVPTGRRAPSHAPFAGALRRCRQGWPGAAGARMLAACLK